MYNLPRTAVFCEAIFPLQNLLLNISLTFTEDLIQEKTAETALVKVGAHLAKQGIVLNYSSSFNKKKS